MHVTGFSVDLNWFLQFIFTAFVVAFGLVHLLKNTASKYFVVDANFEGGGDVSAAPDGTGRSDRDIMPGVIGIGDACAVCGNSTTKQCSGCKVVRYCSQTCQTEHWRSGHKTKCKDFQLTGIGNGGKASCVGSTKSTAAALVPASETLKILKQSKKILFPYDEFVELFNWDKPGFPPCGLLNCGNSCFANVVLQCLAYTRPLVAYLLEKGHRRECRRNDWCFLCEFQTHIERASQSLHPFSPINILSRLPNIGGNLGYGKQEDAHEFMRFAIDTMQSVCLDEFGGEKALHPSSQETTLIQHIFGGHLESQVICTKCNKISNQYENMMDLTVEIQGDAASLEECLDQFTIREWLHGENMYKCDGCNDYVKAWKRLTVRRAPNILTIALKRFQSGRFGKLNKRVTFPETLDLSPYMSEAGNGTDVYKLYAVVVHVDMLNASFFGHYICYTKDFRGNWYRIDDCKVMSVELEEVLSQGAYMLLYSRVCARPSCLKNIEPSKNEEQQTVKVTLVEPCSKRPVECFATAEPTNPISISGFLPSDSTPHSKASSCEKELFVRIDPEAVREDPEDVDMVTSESSSSVSREIEVFGNGHCNAGEIAAPVEHAHRLVSGFVSSSSETSSIEAHNRKCESLSPNSDVVDGNRAVSSCATEVVWLNSSTKSSVPTQNGVCEKGEISRGVSFAALSSVKETLDETMPVSSRGLPISSVEKLEKVKSGKGLSASGCIEDELGKLAGRNPSSGAKLKPLLSPGFLGKRPRNKSMERDGKTLVELGEYASVCKVNGNFNGFAQHGFPHQNGGEIKDQANACWDCNGLSSPSFVEEQPEKCLNEDEMVNIEFSESVNLCNGDANTVISDESASDIVMVDAEDVTFHRQSEDGFIDNRSPCSLGKPLAGKSLTNDGKVHESGTTVHSCKNGTKLQ